MFLHADSEASESSLGARSFCWFCHVAAHINIGRTVSKLLMRNVIVGVKCDFDCSVQILNSLSMISFPESHTATYFVNYLNIEKLPAFSNIECPREVTQIIACLLFYSSVCRS